MASSHPAVGGVSVAPTPRAAGPLPRDDRYRLSSRAVTYCSGWVPQQQTKHARAPFAAAWDVGGVRYVSGTGRAAAKVKLAHGATRETPAIPSFIEIRSACVEVVGTYSVHLVNVSLFDAAVAD